MKTLTSAFMLMVGTTQCALRLLLRWTLLNTIQMPVMMKPMHASTKMMTPAAIEPGVPAWIRSASTCTDHVRWLPPGARHGAMPAAEPGAQGAQGSLQHWFSVVLTGERGLDAEIMSANMHLGQVMEAYEGAVVKEETTARSPTENTNATARAAVGCSLCGAQERAWEVTAGAHSRRSARWAAS